MEFYGKKTLRSFIDEEQRNIQSPTNFSLKAHQPMTTIFEGDPQMSPARPSSASITPSTPDSPWTLSPLHPTPSPSPALFHHCLASLHRHDGNVFSIAISKGLVFTGSESSRVRVWRQPDCTDRGHITSSSGQIRSMLGHGSTLFTTHKDHMIRVWNVTLVSEQFKCRKIATLPKKKNPLLLSFSRHHHQHKDTISCMAFYHADGLLYTGSWDKTVKAWSLSENKCVDSFVAHEDYVNSIAVNQEDGCVFSASSDGSIKIWRRVYGESSHNLTMSLRFQPSPVNALALSSSHTSSCFLYSGSSDGFVNFWEKEAVSGRYNHGGFLQGHRFAVLCLATIEKLVFSGSEDTTIRVWTREEGSGFHSCLAVVEGHRGPVRCLAACLEMEKVVKGILVYSASLDRTVKVWRINLFGGERGGAGMNEAENMELKKKLLEYETSPVLSPSWVEKKLQALH